MALQFYLQLTAAVFLLIQGTGISGLPVLWTEMGIDPHSLRPYLSSATPFEASGGNCDIGTQQSPIDILQCGESEFHSPLRFSGHSDHRPEGFKIMNTGHTAQISFHGTPATLSGGPLLEEYTFLQMHFHWGLTDTLGSEHAIEGNYGSVECHLVHYKTAYSNLSEAVQHPDGVAVVAVLFDLSTEPNTQMSEILDSLDLITNYQNALMLSPTAMYWFGDFANHFRYFTYQGSLTTTPCAEAVTWFVIRKHSTISADQIAKFRQMMVPDGVTPILEYRRPVQELNERSILCPKLAK